MSGDKEFAVLVGKAFLHEISEGRTESAIAFGRAFLLSLGMRGPEPGHRHDQLANGKVSGEAWASAMN